MTAEIVGIAIAGTTAIVGANFALARWLVARYVTSVDQRHGELKDLIADQGRQVREEITRLRSDLGEVERELLAKHVALEGRFNVLVTDLPEQYIRRKELERWMQSVDSRLQVILTRFEGQESAITDFFRKYGGPLEWARAQSLRGNGA